MLEPTVTIWIMGVPQRTVKMSEVGVDYLRGVAAGRCWHDTPDAVSMACHTAYAKLLLSERGL